MKFIDLLKFKFIVSAEVSVCLILLNYKVRYVSRDRKKNRLGNT